MFFILLFLVCFSCPGTTTKWSAPSDPPSPTQLRAGQDVMVDADLPSKIPEEIGRAHV